MNGGLLSKIPVIINSMAKPKMELLPGMDIGNKKGAINSIHDINMPLLPISSKNSLKVIPSSGISEEMSFTTLENLLLR